LRFTAVFLGKSAKLLPVLNLLTWARSLPLFCLHIAGVRFALEPQIKGVATDMEKLAHFTFLEPIQFKRLQHFLTESITVSFCHRVGPTDYCLYTNSLKTSYR
jgi:hypothetical protein